MPGDSERIGEVLVAEGVITQEELVKALSDAGLKGSALSTALESSAHVRRSDLASFLGANFRIPSIEDLRKFDLTEAAAKLVPEEIARKHELVPLCQMGDILCIAKANYYNRAALGELRTSVKLKIKVLQADEAQVRAALDRVYKGKKGDLPAPSSPVRKETSRFAPAAAAPHPSQEAPMLEEVAAFEAIPLISPGGDEPPRRGTSIRPAPAAAVARGGSYDEVIEIMDAIRLSPQDYASALRDPYARLVAEFDDVHQLGRAVPPARVS